MTRLRQVLARHLRRGLSTSSVSHASGPSALFSTAATRDCGHRAGLSAYRSSPDTGMISSAPAVSTIPARRTVTTSPASTTPLAAAKHRQTFSPILELPRETEGWVWPLDDTQIMFDEGHKHGTRYSIPFFTLNSATQLNTEIIQRALVHLYRKTPMFQLSLRERDGRPWWYRPHTLRLDFQVLEDQPDKRDLIDQFFQEKFDEEGSLWKARLIPAAEEDVCPIPELQASFPHQYYVSLITHHGVADGASLAYLCQKFLELLNDIIDDREIDDEKPFGEFVSNEEILRQELLIKKQLMKDPVHLASLEKDVFRSNKPPALLKAFPRPQNVKPATKHILLNLQQDILQNFLTNCKRAGVTFGSGFQALINTAMMEMVKDAGVEDESHDISINMTMNLRRYMQPRSQLPLGLHVRTIAFLMNTDKNVREHFWEYTRYFQQIAKKNLKSKLVLKQEVVRQMVMPKVSPRAFYEGPPEVIRDYGFNNISDLHTLVKGEGKHVQMTNLQQFTAVHKFLYTHLHQVFTFRDTCKYTISYATEHMTEDTANLLVARVMALMRDFSR